MSFSLLFHESCPDTDNYKPAVRTKRSSVAMSFDPLISLLKIWAPNIMVGLGGLCAFLEECCSNALSIFYTIPICSKNIATTFSYLCVVSCSIEGLMKMQKLANSKRRKTSLQLPKLSNIICPIDAFVPYHLQMNALICDNIIELYNDTSVIQRGMFIASVGGEVTQFLLDAFSEYYRCPCNQKSCTSIFCCFEV